MTNAGTGAATKQLPVRLPEPVYRALKGASAYSGRSMNDIVCAAVVDYLTRDRSALESAAETARAEYRAVLDKLADL